MLDVVTLYELILIPHESLTDDYGFMINLVIHIPII